MSEKLRQALEQIATSCEIDTLQAAIDCAREALAAEPRKIDLCPNPIAWRWQDDSGFGGSPRFFYADSRPQGEFHNRAIPLYGAPLGHNIWPNRCNIKAPQALRYLAENPRPNGGQELFNSEHLFQIADELDKAFGR